MSANDKLCAGINSQAATCESPEDLIPLPYHYHMLADQTRLTAFREAIEYLVKPGANVLELGGGTGVLSFFAAQKARRVWCVEKIGQLARTARKFLEQNRVGSRVEVIEADANDFLPPEPVDVVICEMLHVGLLREKQIAVIQSFKQRYAEKFGPRLPQFIPEVSFLAVQPVEQSFSFQGFVAPVTVFQAPLAEQPGTLSLGDPVLYGALEFRESLPSEFTWQGELQIANAGTLNALRFVTKNITAVLETEGRASEWANQFLVLPLAKSLAVRAGDRIRIDFSYRAGDPLDVLSDSLNANVVVTPQQIERAA